MLPEHATPNVETRISVHLRRAPDEDVVAAGVCPLCGARPTRLAWRLAFLDRPQPFDPEDNPGVYRICDPCRRTLHEFAEIAFGEAMGGRIDLRVD